MAGQNPIANDHWSIQLIGTFDLHNYGDLLFPLVFERAMNQRLGPGRLTLASPKGGPFIPDPTRRVNRFRQRDEADYYDQFDQHQAIIVGGGDLLRFDDQNLGGPYGESALAALHRRGYSAMVEDLAAMAPAMPIVWNAVGVPFDIPSEQHASVRQLLDQSRLVSVRDELSRDRLLATGTAAAINVVSDTAMLLPNLFPTVVLERTIGELQAAGCYPRDGDPLVVHVPHAWLGQQVALAGSLLRLCQVYPSVRPVILPIGICLGDLEAARHLGQLLAGRAHVVDRETSIEEVAAAIKYARAFAGVSLHGNITALAYGVPHLTLAIAPNAPSKLRAYAQHARRGNALVERIEDLEMRLQALVTGAYPVDPSAYSGSCQQVEQHFDRIAACVRGLSAPDLQAVAADHRRLVARLAPTRPAGTDGSDDDAAVGAAGDFTAPSESAALEAYRLVNERDARLQGLTGYIVHLQAAILDRDRTIARLVHEAATQAEVSNQAQASSAEESTQLRQVVASLQAAEDHEGSAGVSLRDRLSECQRAQALLAEQLDERQRAVAWLLSEVAEARSGRYLRRVARQRLVHLVDAVGLGRPLRRLRGRVS